MENETKIDLRIRISYIGMILLTVALVLPLSLLLGRSYEIILRNTVVSVLITGAVIFMLLDATYRGGEAFSFDNYDHRFRFIIVYVLGLVLACAFSLIPNQFWTYLALFVVLGLVSNMEIGLLSGTGLVAISVMLEENGSYSEFLMYVLAGAVAVAIFRGLKENTSIGFLVAIALMIQAVLLVAFSVLFQNRTLSFNLLMGPVLNLMLNLIILLIFLNIFGVYVIRKTNDMYMEINDAEHPLLVRLKEANKDEYYREIHIAYLAERLAIGLGLNERAVKCCSYYHRIGILENKESWQDVNHFYNDNSFPKEAVELLHEYIEPVKGKNRSRETLCVKLSEELVSSILSVLAKDKNVKIDYDQMIDTIFNTKLTDGSLKNYDVTFSEYESMRKLLKKEKLYYDFLR